MWDGVDVTSPDGLRIEVKRTVALSALEGMGLRRLSFDELQAELRALGLNAITKPDTHAKPRLRARRPASKIGRLVQSVPSDTPETYPES